MFYSRFDARIEPTTMNDLNLYIKLSMLPKSLKSEILDYMDYLLAKRAKVGKRLDVHPKAGFLKGTFEMSPDFEQPLDDFSEYME